MHPYTDLRVGGRNVTKPLCDKKKLSQMLENHVAALRALQMTPSVKNTKPTKPHQITLYTRCCIAVSPLCASKCIESHRHCASQAAICFELGLITVAGQQGCKAA